MPAAGVDHRLDGEAVARAHDANRLVARVVRHVGRRVEEVVDAVADKRFHHAAAKALALRCLGNHFANVPIEHAGLARRNRRGGARARAFHQARTVLVNFATIKCCITIKFLYRKGKRKRRKWKEMNKENKEIK